MPTTPSALDVANSSFDWYARNAGRSRLRHQIQEVTLLIVASAIPLAAFVTAVADWATAALGVGVLILTGLRQIFHWHENYLRFTQACSSLNAARQRYQFGVEPYDDPATRDQLLLDEVIRIETQETGAWIESSRQANSALSTTSPSVSQLPSSSS